MTSTPDTRAAKALAKWRAGHGSPADLATALSDLLAYRPDSCPPLAGATWEGEKTARFAHPLLIEELKRIRERNDRDNQRNRRHSRVSTRPEQDRNDLLRHVSALSAWLDKANQEATTLRARLQEEQEAAAAAEREKLQLHEELRGLREVLWTARIALENSYDVTDWPADGTSQQAKAIEKIKEATAKTRDDGAALPLQGEEGKGGVNG